MLNMVNTTSIKEIELYIEVVQVKPQVNQYMGDHIDLLIRDNYNVVEFDMVVSLVAVQYRILEYMEMMKTEVMKKLMINLMKMLMMNLMETQMLKLMDMYHPSRFSIKFWRMSKGYMSLPLQHLVMYRITQMLRNHLY